MADFLTTSTTLDFSKVAYDQMAYFALRPQLFFDQVADVEPTHQSMPGLSVVFQIMNDIPPQTNPLTEGVDVSAIAMSDTTLTLTLQEYGAALIHTAKLRGTSFVQIDPIAANIIGFNAGVSLDSIARDVLTLGNQSAFPAAGGHTSRATVAKTDTLASGDIRIARAALRRQNVPEIGNAFVAFVHPDAVVDLQSEAGTSGNALNSWRAPHTYSAPSEIWSGEIGQYEGIRFIETPRAPIANGAGAGNTLFALSTTSGSTTATYTGATYDPQVGATVYGANVTTAPTSFSGALGSTYITAVVPSVNSTTGYITPGAGTVTLNKAATATTTTVAGASFAMGGANVYQTLIMGRQALAKTHSVVDGNSAYPHIVPGPVVDRLRRNVPLGWYWMGAYGIFRQAALYRLEHGSSLDQAIAPAGGGDISTGGSEGTDTPLVDLS